MPKPDPKPVTLVEGEAFDLSELVGREVTLVGTQTRTKIPSVCGVDVWGLDDHADRRVTASGVLRCREVAPRGPDEPIVASRGPGRYYYLAKDGGGLAETSLRG